MKNSVLAFLFIAGMALGGLTGWSLVAGANQAGASPVLQDEAPSAHEISQQALCNCNVIVVAKSNGDFTSVKAALDSITSASSSNRYLVWVGPGEYTETGLVEVKSYVHLQGAGPNVTIIKSSRSSGTPNSSAATVDLKDNGRLSDINIVNEGASLISIAVYSAGASRDAVIDNVLAQASGSGGAGHYALYLNDSEPTIQNSILIATGATGFGTGVNAGLGSVNVSGGFPQALILNSQLIGGNNNGQACVDITGTGFGLRLTNSSPTVRHSYICGGHRGVAVYTNGHALIEQSLVRVSSTGSAFLFEISSAGTISVANSGVSYIGNKFTGGGSGLRCVHAYQLGTQLPVSNGTSAATACN